MNKLNFKIIVLFFIQIIGFKSKCYAEADLIGFKFSDLCDSGEFNDILHNQKIGLKRTGDAYVYELDENIVLRKTEIPLAKKEESQDLLNEINVMNCLTDSGVDGYSRSPKKCVFFINDQTSIVFQYTERIRFGSLLDLIYLNPHRISYPEWLIYTLGEMARVLAKLHAIGVMHRDISPKEIIFKNKELTEVVYVDFQSATFEKTSRIPVGSFGFVAPEIINLVERKGQKEKTALKPSYTKKVDVFSLGMTFYFLCTKGSVLKTDKNGRYFPLEIPPEVPDRVKPILEGMLKFNPAERMTAAEVKKAVDELLSQKLII